MTSHGSVILCRGSENVVFCLCAVTPSPPPPRSYLHTKRCVRSAAQCLGRAGLFYRFADSCSTIVVRVRGRKRHFCSGCTLCHRNLANGEGYDLDEPIGAQERGQLTVLCLTACAQRRQDHGRERERAAAFVRILSNGLNSEGNKSDVWDAQKRDRLRGKFLLELFSGVLGYPLVPAPLVRAVTGFVSLTLIDSKKP